MSTAVINSNQANLKSIMSHDATKKRFHEILGKKSAGFISSVLSVANSNLKNAEPQSVLNAAVIAATLDLPINPNLGFAYIVPYGSQAQFQMGAKGFIQLAMRSGQYKTINVREVREGEIVKESKFTGEYEFGEATSDEVVGYMAYFKLLNGFEKFFYMTKGELEAHGKKYSKNYNGLWKSNFDSMAKKTVLKLALSKYGVLSIEMQMAQTFDQSVIKNDMVSNNVEEAEIEYIDNKQASDRLAEIASATATQEMQ